MLNTPCINSDKIKNYIKSNNLTPTTFCKKCGISFYSFKKIMKGSCKIRIGTFLRVVKMLKVLPTDLLYFK